MALDKSQLEQNILQAFQTAAQAPDIGASQQQLASGLADAIDRYVTAAAVRGIQVDLTKESPAAQIADGTLA